MALSRIAKVAAVLALFATPVFAADADDPRIPPIEIEGLSAAVGKVMEHGAHLGAMLDVEMADHAKDRQQLVDLQKWVREYFGE